MNIADGFYDGTIKGVEIEEDTFNTDGMVACFDVDLEPSGAVRCRHRSHGDNADRTLDTLEVLGLPRELRSFTRLQETIGKVVRVRVKTSDKGRQNSYITSQRKAKVLGEDEVIRRLDDSDVPF